MRISRVRRACLPPEPARSNGPICARGRRAVIERLECRWLLSAQAMVGARSARQILAGAGLLQSVARPAVALTLAPLSQRITTTSRTLHPAYELVRHAGVNRPFASSAPSGLTPTQIRHAYGFDLVTLSGGIVGDGSGQTIAIVDAYNAPTIKADLQAFDAQFGLPDPPSFQVVSQTGSTTSLPSTDPSSPGNNTWEIETALDVEWAHALAPKANLLLVEANSASDADLIQAAVVYAKSQTGVAAVSMSWGGGESSGDTSFNTYFTTPTGHTGVTFLAATGDAGQPSGYPAFSPNVVAVGGTTLSVDASGNYLSESGWSGSGGSVSTVESQPSYQHGVVTQSSTMRANPDVSFDADPNSGVPVYDSYDFGSSTPWLQVGGTSFSTPAWAAIIAIADQGRLAASLQPLDGRNDTLPKLYSISASDYHDITSGNNGFAAGVGYDLVTGIGTPKVPSIVTDLVGVPATFAVASTTPSAGSTVTVTAPTDFAITFNTAYNSSSVSAGDLQVNGVAATSFTLTSSTVVTFHYGTSPATQGLNTMSIAAGAITRQTDSAALVAFSGQFRYDAVVIAPTSTTPANGASVTLPFSSLTVQFNEPFANSSIATSNLTVSRGTVSGFTINGTQSVTYTISGVNSPGTLSYSIAAGAITDVYGNGGSAYSGSVVLNSGPVPFPTPLSAVAPSGSLVYQNSTTGTIGAGTTDTYTLAIAAGQTLSLLVTPASSLQSQVTVTGPGVSSSATGTAAGSTTALQTIAISTAGTYTFTVSGASGTTGSYTIAAYLNAALAPALTGGPANHTLATAQNIDAAFATLGGNSQRAAALGTLPTPVASDTYGYNVVRAAYQFDDISTTGTAVLKNVDDNYVQLTTANLAGFTFKLYDTTYNTLYVSSNGLITFGSGNGAWANNDLTSIANPQNGGTSNQAALAVYWDDLYVRGQTASGVYWQVKGAGATQRLIVQWNDVSFYSGSQTGKIVFQAILNADGSVLYNYQNLVTGSTTFDNGASATVGIRDSGTQGARRIVVSQNTASNPNVQNGVSLQILQGGSGADYYAMTVSAPQTITLAAAARSAGTVAVALANSSGTVLASGTTPGSGTDLNSLVENYSITTSGTYYIVVSGTFGASYTVAAVRNADFATEANGSFSTAQDITAVHNALGAIPSGGPTTENWYSLNLSAGQNLSAQLSTLGGSNSQFINTLAPQLQLYSPSNTLVATGQGSSAAINQNIAASGLYRLRVLGGSSSGEYFLSTSVVVLPLTVNIPPVSPSPRNTSVGQMSLVFSGVASGVTLGALALSRDGGPNLLAQSQTLTTSDSITYTLGNLSSLTAASGTYTLTLTAAGSGIHDSGNNPLASGATASFVVDVVPPTATIPGVSPNPRNSAVPQLQITFSEPVNGFTLASLDLSLGGGGNLLTSQQTLTTSDNQNFTLGGVSSLTGASGTYTLTLSPSGISDLATNAMATGATRSFIVDTVPPTATITPSGLRNSPLSQFQIVFSEPVQGLSLADVQLTDGAGPNLLTGSQTLTTSDNITYTLGNVASLLAPDGSYTLKLSATGSGVTDFAGNALAADASTTITIDTTAPTATFAAITPNPRSKGIDQEQVTFSEPVNGVTLAAFTLSADGGPNLLGAGVTLSTADNVTYTLGNLTALTSTSGDYALKLTAASSGITDLAGNAIASDATTSVTVITDPPRVAGVYVRGDWSQSFLSNLAAQGLGDAQLGYRVPAGANQLATLPWNNITTMSVVFTQDVSIDSANAGLGVTGSTGAAPLAAATFSYTAATHTAQWTLPAALPADKLLLTLPSAAVANRAGTALDGEWTNPSGGGASSTYPSGDGQPGGDFAFRFNVLPGDANQSGAVSALDGIGARLLLNTTAQSGGGYSALYDIDGDGSITSSDVAAIRASLLQVLPTAEPVGPLSSSLAHSAALDSYFERLGGGSV